MGFKTDKEYEERDDISLLSEIIANSIYWQVIYRGGSFKLVANL